MEKLVKNFQDAYSHKEARKKNSSSTLYSALSRKAPAGVERKEKPPHQNTCQHGEFQDDKNVIKLGTLRKFPQRVFPPAALLHMLRSGNECRPQWRSAEQSEKTFCLQLLFRWMKNKSISWITSQKTTRLSLELRRWCSRKKLSHSFWRISLKVIQQPRSV